MRGICGSGSYVVFPLDYNREFDTLFDNINGWKFSGESKWQWLNLVQNKRKSCKRFNPVDYD